MVLSIANGSIRTKRDRGQRSQVRTGHKRGRTQVRTEERGSQLGQTVEDTSEDKTQERKDTIEDRGKRPLVKLRS